MCLHVTIREMEGGGRLPAAAIVSRASGLTVQREHGSRINTLQMFAWKKDCGCGLLAPGASVDAETWSLDANLVPRIEAALMFVSKHTKRFGFSALFFGEDAATEIVISRRDLSEIVLQNRVRNYVRYVVVSTLSQRNRAG